MAFSCVASMMMVNMPNIRPSNVRKSSRKIVPGGEYGEQVRQSFFTHSANCVTTRKSVCIEMDAM